jgi:ADP-ribosyl-[dinitrogen reductase] hydrolase
MLKGNKLIKIGMAVALLFSVTVFNGCDDNDQEVEAVPTVQTSWNEKTVELTYPTDGITTEDRIKGAIMGALIGDALGVGCHWYDFVDDFEALWTDYGTWIDDYVDPQEDNRYGKLRYDAGVRGGWNSQSGQLIQVLLEVIAESTAGGTTKGEFVAADYAAAVEDFFKNQLLPAATFADAGNIDGLSGRFTDRAIRENFDVWYNKGAMDGDWSSDTDIASITSTSDAAQFGVILAALYRDPEELFPKAYELARIWYSDMAFISNHVMYIMTVQAIINGVPLEDLPGHIRNTVSTAGAIGKFISSYDDMHTPTVQMTMAQKPMLSYLPDDRFVSKIFGTDCHQAHLLPAVYYYAYKYAHDFEKAVLLPINSSGNNMARAALTGGLVGAMVGIDGIPQRFIDGLDNDPALIPDSFESQSQYLLDMVQAVAKGTKHAKQ